MSCNLLTATEKLGISMIKEIIVPIPGIADVNMLRIKANKNANQYSLTVERPVKLAKLVKNSLMASPKLTCLGEPEPLTPVCP